MNLELEARIHQGYDPHKRPWDYVVAIVITAALTMVMYVLTGCGSGGEGDTSSTLSAEPSQRPRTGSPPSQPDILTVTNQGLQRGKANGQEQRLVFAQTNMHQSFSTISQGHVLYRKTEDVWAVRTDGAENRAIVNTPDSEFIVAVNGPWLIYGQEVAQPSGRLVTRYGSANIDTGARFQFNDSEGTAFIPQSEARLISTTSQEQISSLTVQGTNRLTYDALTPAEQQTRGYFLATKQIVGTTLIYSRGASVAPSTFFSRTLAIPLGGGVATLLDEEQYDTYSAWSVGDRVIYHRCQNTEPYFCDVASVQTNGANRTVLTTHPANEAVQGTVGNQVIIRRNLAGNDQLIVVPVAGGAEKLLMTMTDNEFVDLTADDLIIVRRPSGTWTLDLNGTLKQIGTVAMNPGFMFVGNALCGNSGATVWCMPLDGSTPAVRIAETGTVIGAL